MYLVSSSSTLGSNASQGRYVGFMDTAIIVFASGSLLKHRRGPSSMLYLPLSVLEMSRIFTQEMGQQRKPKSPAAHCTARSQVLSSSTVFVCGYDATIISSLGLLERARHRSKCPIMFLHCFPRGCTTNSPGWSGTKTSWRASAASSWAAVLDQIAALSGVERELHTCKFSCLDVWIEGCLA